MDKPSFEQLYIELLPSLYRLAKSILYQSQDAEDAVQSAALKALKAADRLKQGSERAYIARIVINECHNIQRRRQRETVTDSLPEAASEPPQSELKAAIDALPEKLRLPLLIKYMEGYSEEEAARICGITKSALKSRLYKARRSLRQQLSGEVTHS